MKYHSALKKKEIIKFAEKWVDLECIVLSKVIQYRKGKNTFSCSYVEFTQ